jgi:hypothetical protein
MLPDEVSEIPYMRGCVPADNWKSFPMFHVSSLSVQLELVLCKCVTLVRAYALKQCMHFVQIVMLLSYYYFYYYY